MTARACERWLAAASTAAALTCTNLAWAHAPPAASDIQWLGGRALVRTNRGLIVQEADLKSFRLLCNDAFHTSLVEVPPLASTSDGRLWIGTFASGMLRASADLCSFESSGGTFSGLNTSAIAVDSRGLIRALLLPEDGSPAALVESRDDGRSFLSLATFGDSPTALAVAPSDGDRVYISMLGFSETTTFAHWLRSTDGGRTFADFPIALDESELRVFVLAVDPRAPERVFARTQSRDGQTPERLLRSEDGGQSFVSVLLSPGPLSLTVTPNGTVWAGSATGLYRSDDQGHTFTLQPLPELSRISCLASKGEQLYVCGFYDGQFGVLSTSEPSASLSWFLRFPEVRARLDCGPGSDEALRCDSAFKDWSLEQGALTPSTDGSGGNPGEVSGATAGKAGNVAQPGCALPPRACLADGFTSLWLALASAVFAGGRRSRGAMRRE